MNRDPETSGGRIYQINISNGGVPKLPVPQADVTSLGLVGDHQRSTEIHGGVERALCLYSLDLIRELQAEGHPISPGGAGENVTISGIDWSKVGPGARLRLGDSVLVEVTRFTAPCENIAHNFAGERFTRISHKVHPGWSRVYARVIETGIIKTGDPVSLDT